MKKRNSFNDIILSFVLRLKLMVSSRVTIIAFAIASAAFLLVLNNLNLHAEENSAIPVGIVNEDDDPVSCEIVERLKNVKSIYVYEGSFDEMESLLLDGYISSVFVIKDGCGESIRKGEPEETVKLYFGKDDRTCAVIGDIVAGEMMYEVCLYGGLMHYHRLSDRGHSDDEYIEYVNELAKEDTYNFSFETEYYDGNKEAEEGISNSVLYRQMIAGMVAMLLSFVILFSFSQNVLETEQGITGRRKATLLGRVSASLGDITAVTVCCLILCILIAASTANSVGSMSAFFEILGVSVIYVIVMAVIMTVLSRISKNINMYQITGGALLLVFGIAGFAGVFSGFLGEALSVVLSAVPNSIFIKLFTNAVC